MTSCGVDRRPPETRQELFKLQIPSELRGSNFRRLWSASGTPCRLGHCMKISSAIPNCLLTIGRLLTIHCLTAICWLPPGSLPLRHGTIHSAADVSLPPGNVHLRHGIRHGVTDIGEAYRNIYHKVGDDHVVFLGEDEK